MSETESIPFNIEGHIGEIKAAEQLCPGVYYVSALNPEIGLPQEYYAVNKSEAPLSPQNNIFGVDYQTKAGMKRAVLYNEGFHCKAYPSKYERVDTLPDYGKYQRPNMLLSRLLAGRCELCGVQTDEVCVHQVKKLKDLRGNKRWEQVMLAKRRKTLVLCKDCHQNLHDGLYD